MSGGLTSEEAARLLGKVGPNALPEASPMPLWLRFARQFQSPLIYLLVFAFTFDLGLWVYEGASGWPIEAIAIAAILLLNAGLGAFQEYRSEQALAHLEALAAPLTWVVRDGGLVHIPSRDLVPGDLVRAEAGERVPADGTLTDAHGVLADEAVLTGESVPLDKSVGEALFSGTLVVRGQGFFRVTKTGASSTMGRLATMLGEIQAEKTPLERRLEALGKLIARWVGGLAVVLALMGIAAEGIDQFEEMVFFAIALAVAAVPEGMPAVVTLTLALGVQRMARRHAIVRRLSAVEALGSVTVIATDKTGTLTESRMEVRALETDNAGVALLAMALANDADAGSKAGDPLELGLLEYVASQGLDVAAVRRAHPRVSVRPFDSGWKFMRVTVEGAEGTWSYLKGAPEIVLERCALTPAERERWAARAEALANDGYRLLGFAAGPGENEADLSFLGFAMLWDPPRPEVPDAIRLAQAAGVRVLMVTGDHPGTARAVARAIGMTGTDTLTGTDIDGLSGDALRAAVRSASVFARVSPEHKLRLVEALKADGQIVAMTGDGVNDAPALKRSDVGVAMGRRGSDVAREVADLVLLDDNFASIVGAIEEGRGIYENIQKFMRFLFSTNVALVLLVVAGAIGSFVLDLREASGGLLLPLTAIQLLWINFIADGPPALALALDRNPDVMRHPPRPPQSPLLDTPSLRFVFSTGVLKALSGALLLILLPVCGYAVAAVRSIVFLFESTAQLVFAYPARRVGHRPSRNATLHAIVVLGVGLQLLTIAVPALRTLLGLESLDWPTVAVAGGTAATTWMLAEIVNRLLLRQGAVQRSEPTLDP
jgi:Ca2+-transporting ATPase